MEMNIWAILLAGLSTLLIGFIWYHPKVFGIPWMKAAGLTEAQLKGGNMFLIFGLSLFLGFLIAFELQFITIHQTGAVSMVGGNPEKALPSFQVFMDDYGHAYRTFNHGVLHGLIAGLFFALPIIAVNAMFERKNFKYVAINAGYWIVSLMIMGGIICAWV